ncbi:vitamin B12 dependent-methionine synthase activation domain-containing protein [Hugonella massiliensis]|uniref:vitamin B12 dependent-methionine synthase activation domain-containing protein n=1 Tax=Hugonella massiliensis TaxID=1720315 RepID=UPI00073F2957|nr:vitamin B12 dependent-methionine synthase activation domain-containing protein [Hugonella massiliensis]
MSGWEPVREGRPSVTVDRAEALRYLGYAGQPISDELSGRMEDLFAACERTCNPAFVYRVFPLAPVDGGLALEGSGVVLPGTDIARHLKGARSVAAMAATAGLASERELRRLSATNGLDAMVYGAGASSIAEAASDACNAAIVAEARSAGFYTSWRYSPGYGDLPLDVQPSIVRALDATKRIGVTVTPTNLLVPAKSVTALVGLFDEPREDRRSCAGCSCAPYCNLRKAGTPCYR